MGGSVQTLTEIAPLRLALVRLGRRIRKHSQAGLTPSQISALSTIQRHGPTRLGQLAEREQIGKSSTTRLVARLEGLGLIERRSDTSDARGSWVDLTSEGAQLLERSSRLADEYLAHQVSRLGREDRQRLMAAVPVLERLLDVQA